MIKPGESKEEFALRVKEQTEEVYEVMEKAWWERLSCVANEMFIMNKYAPEMIRSFVEKVEEELQKDNESSSLH